MAVEFTLGPDLYELFIQTMILLVFALQNDFGKSVGLENESQLHQLNSSNKQNELYMAGIVHDLRNPVSCLQTFFELLKAQKLE